MAEGENHLSAFDNKLWALHQHLILKFNCYTLFKVQSMHIPRGIPCIIFWMVPKQHPNAFEIHQYLENELRGEEIPVGTPGYELPPDPPWPGKYVRLKIMEFEGVQGYLEQDAWLRIAEDITDRWKKLLAGRDEIDGGT